MDDELKTMAEIFALLEKLDDGARSRVLSWAGNKFGVKNLGSITASPVMGSVITGAEPAFHTFADLFDAASPTSNSDKALVAGYWLQNCQGLADFPSQMVNKELQNLGHLIPNITDAFTQLKDKKPALAIQVKKSGKSQQARKQYKLTTAGVALVKNLIDEKH